MSLVYVPRRKEIAMSRESLPDREVVYRKLIEAALDAIVVADQEGSIVLVNAQAEKLFEYKRTELLDESLPRGCGESIDSIGPAICLVPLPDQWKPTWN